MAAILVVGVARVGLPLVGGKRRALQTDSATFQAAKAFAAGVILATGFIHMLHDAEHALSSPCLPVAPWRWFPFPGFVAMAAALTTLVLDFLATRFYESKHRYEAARIKAAATAVLAASSMSNEGITVVTVTEDELKTLLLQTHCRGHGHGHGHHHNHAHELVPVEGADREVSAHVQNVVVSVLQLLEMGIVSHSVIIGLSLGVSRSPRTIKPLIAALAFHQFSEGFALGECIAQVTIPEGPLSQQSGANNYLGDEDGDMNAFRDSLAHVLFANRE